jgi:prepilin-type N-terminal cleavage/methylation domain-containing protein
MVTTPSGPAVPPVERIERTDLGFTLVEMAIVIIIAGVMLAAAAAIALPMIQEARLVGTQAKMDKLAKALDYYAVHNNRMPCPAAPNVTPPGGEPFGYEQGSGASGSTVPATCPGTVGIVPYKTLGIPNDWAIDGWGDYITYAISPAYSQNTTTDIPVHARCRTADWYDAPMVYEPNMPNPPVPFPAPVYTHKNPAKARFCCPYPTLYAPSTDLVVNDVLGNPMLVSSRLSNGTTPPSGAPMSTTVPFALDANGAITPNSYPVSTDRPTSPVYVLVSHGADGYGHYNVNTGARISTTGTSATPDEKKNASDTGIYFDIPKIDRSGAEKGFDDVVLWRTQDIIFAEQGETCAGP